MATVPGSRVAAANPRRSMRFWKDAGLSTIQYARGHEKLTPRLWRRPIRISSTLVKTRNDSRPRSPLPLTLSGMNQRSLSMAIGALAFEAVLRDHPGQPWMNAAILDRPRACRRH
jgi:hypothetical protein